MSGSIAAWPSRTSVSCAAKRHRPSRSPSICRSCCTTSASGACTAHSTAWARTLRFRSPSKPADDRRRVADQRADLGAEQPARPEPAAAQPLRLGQQPGPHRQASQRLLFDARQVRRELGEQVDLQPHRQPHELAGEGGMALALGQRFAQRSAHGVEPSGAPAFVPPPPGGVRRQQRHAHRQGERLGEEHHADQGVRRHRGTPPAPTADVA